MKQYAPGEMVRNSRYSAYFPTAPADVQTDALARIGELIEEEKQWCDKGNYGHLCNILTAIALYEVLQTHGKSEEDAYKIVSEEMWKSLDPSGMKKLAPRKFFLPLMKKVVPAGFNKMSGAGWRYTWHPEDPKDEFHFECNECLYKHIFEPRDLLERLGPMWCHADIVNYGELPYTDFIRTQTLCQGGELCDFRFVRHATDAGDGWERTNSI